MAIGTVAGCCSASRRFRSWRRCARRGVGHHHFFRNAPWLVLLFYCMFLLPFQVTVFGVTIPLPDWMKATLGLALPVMANVAEIAARRRAVDPDRAMGSPRRRSPSRAGRRCG